MNPRSVWNGRLEIPGSTVSRRRGSRFELGIDHSAKRKTETKTVSKFRTPDRQFWIPLFAFKTRVSSRWCRFYLVLAGSNAERDHQPGSIESILQESQRLRRFVQISEYLSPSLRERKQKTQFCSQTSRMQDQVSNLLSLIFVPKKQDKTVRIIFCCSVMTYAFDVFLSMKVSVHAAALAQSGTGEALESSEQGLGLASLDCLNEGET